MTSTIEEINPDLIEAEADDLESKALALRAKAKRLRAAHASGVGVEWLADAQMRERFGIRIRACVEAAARGEPIEVRYAGRSPRVRVTEVEAWMKWRSSRVTKPKAPPANDSVDAQYEALVSGKRAG